MSCGDRRHLVFIGVLQRKDRVFHAANFNLEKLREHAVLGQRPVQPGVRLVLVPQDS